MFASRKHDVWRHVKYKFRNRDWVYFYRIKNKNTVSVSLYIDGHVIAAQPIGE